MSDGNKTTDRAVLEQYGDVRQAFDEFMVMLSAPATDGLALDIQNAFDALGEWIEEFKK